MKNIPETTNALVLRTDFSDDNAWSVICAMIREPAGEFQAYVDFVNDPTFMNIGVEQLPSLMSKNTRHKFMFIVDLLAFLHPDHPILVMDLFEEPGRTFRVIPSGMWGVENNLSVANMDFVEFVDGVDPDGIFRGFPEG